ncbi:MAG TPA: hypothetical protein VMT69_02015 [Kineosporiaceae bacterium]|nr:hypothetical protein [Kineosporiaceae bacterium]
MTYSESTPAAVTAWFTQRLPQDWTVAAPPQVTVDREEITVLLTLTAPETAEGATDAEKAEGIAGLAARFREDTRDRRIAIAREAEHRFRRKVAWGVRVGGTTELFTHLAVPVMTRLRQPERQVLDTLVDAGVARSRAHALAWCVRLVGRNTASWLGDLRRAMEQVEQVRDAGPTATGPQAGPPAD